MPRAKQQQTRHIELTVLVTPDESIELREAAEEAFLPLSTYIRAMALTTAREKRARTTRRELAASPAE